MVELSYQRRGSGPSVVFVHNAGSDRHNWDGVVEQLSDRWTTWAVDLPGYGGSSCAEPQSLELHAGALTEFLDIHGLSDVHLVGHCVGGATCWQLALRQPERVASLTLFSPATEATMRAGMWGPLYRVSRRSRRLLGVARRGVRVARHVPLMRYATLRSMFGATGPDDAFSAHNDQLMLRDGAIDTLADLLRRFDSFGVLDRTGRPDDFPRTMLVWGTKNRVLPVNMLPHVERCLRPERVEVLDGVGHLVMVEEVARSAALLEDWLSAEGPGSRTPPVDLQAPK